MKKNKIIPPKNKPYEINEPEVNHFNEIDLSGTYSYASYLRWKFEERVELIKGKVFQMGAPLVDHQRITGLIYAELYGFLKERRCEAFVAPFDVRFPKASKEDRDVYTVLQPDVCVVCDPAKIDRRGCIGAPDIVVEVLSPGNTKKELYNKFKVYEEFGVKEYWIVHLTERYFDKYIRNEDGVFIAGSPYTCGSQFGSDILPAFRLNIDEVFGVMKDQDEG